MTWNIYLSGEIRTDWREKIEAGLKAADLPINLSTPNTDHAQVMIVGTDFLVLKITLSGKITRHQRLIPFAFVI